MAKTKRELSPAPAAPSDLTERAKALWNAAMSTGSRSPQRLVVIEEALRALDLAERARQAVLADGLTSTTARTGACHVHPAARVERENRQLFCKLWRSLGLTFDCRLDRRLDDPLASLMDD